MNYTAQDVAAAIAKVDDMLRDVGFVANGGGCTCSRCETRQARAAAPADTPDVSGGIGGQLVDAPQPAPRAPRPGGIALKVPDRARYEAIRACDEIVF